LSGPLPATAWLPEPGSEDPPPFVDVDPPAPGSGEDPNADVALHDALPGDPALGRDEDDEDEAMSAEVARQRGAAVARDPLGGCRIDLERRRVVVDAGYDRTLAKPLFNCLDCYEKKERAKKQKPPAD